MTIRPYQPRDADAVWELHNLALQGTGAHLGNGPWDEDLKRIPEEYEGRGGAFLVGVLDGRIVAMGGVRPVAGASCPRAELRRMRVHPGFQRRGLGAALLGALESEAARLGCRELRLETAAIQTAARGLYERNGYRVTGRGRVGGLDTLVYEKALSRPEAT
jgi:ribosomal protein S18 acetylase RimI-like enzyme